MKYWQVVSWCETEQLPAVAQHAEQLGFEGIILAEHIYYPRENASQYYYSEDGRSPQNQEMEFPDPLISFAAAAALTSTLKMMTGIYVLPLRHPVDAAKNMATLARLSNNRFSLGFGAGWLAEEFEQLGVDFASRGRRMDEMLEIMKALWSGEALCYHGAHFDIDDIQIRPYPAEQIPLIAGGHSDKALARAAQRCDGWYGPGNTTAELAAIVPRLKRARLEAGLRLHNFEIIAPLTEPLTKANCATLEELGVTATVSYPFLFGCGPDTSLGQKKTYMDDFAAAHFN